MSHSSDSGNALLSSSAQADDALMQARIVDGDGRPADVLSVEHAGRDALVRIRVASGPEVLVPVSMLSQQSDGAYRLPFSFDADANGERQQVIFPVRQERLRVGKRSVDTGRGVRIHKTVVKREHIIDEPLLHDELEVEHIPVGAIVAGDEPPRMRYEGDTLVVPVLEEVLVVQKQWRLKEEVRVRRRRREVHAPQSVSVRTEQVTAERFDESMNKGKGGLA